MKGDWVAQLVKRQTLDLSSGHDLTVLGSNSQVELCTDSGDLLGILSLPLSALPLLILSLSEKVHKHEKKRNRPSSWFKKKESEMNIKSNLIGTQFLLR